jgi:hypothetical protein
MPTASGPVADGDRDHQRELAFELREDLLRRDDRGLCVERVEDGLDQQEVDTALDESTHLLRVGLAQRVEAERAKRRVVHVRRERERLAAGPDGAGHEARLVRRPRAPGVRHPAGQPGGLEVDLPGELLHAVVGLGDARGAEGVGLDQVGARRAVGVVDLLDRVRTGQHQKVVVALELRCVAAQARAPEVRLLEPLGLEHGAHGPVQDEDALGEQLLELLASVRGGHDGLGAYRAQQRARRGG